MGSRGTCDMYPLQVFCLIMLDLDGDMSDGVQGDGHMGNEAIAQVIAIVIIMHRSRWGTGVMGHMGMGHIGHMSITP